MLRVLDSKFASGRNASLRATSLTVLGLAVALSGCSASITRFDDAPFGHNGGATTTGSVPRPPAGLGVSGENTLSAQSPSVDRGRNYSSGYGGGYEPPRARRSEVETAALAPPPSSSIRSPRSQSRTMVDYAPEEPVASRGYAPAPSGGDIVVAPGDTLYGLSRRHGVSVSALMSENGLSNSNLSPGQRLRLPSGASSSAGVAPSREVSRPPRDVIAAAEAPSDWTGSYEVSSGDSLYVIARRYGVRVSDLQRFNGISDPRKIRPGVVLKVPGVAGGTGASTTTRVAAVTPPEAPSVLDDASPSRPSILNRSASTPAKPVQTVRVSPPRSMATVSSANKGNDAISKLRWPIRGKIIDRFGPRTDGTHNDGVNLSVPMGADVHAAEAGVVAYAGSELKGYGKLVLVRHENGWVTAYAHNSELLVKRGDKVKRGQVISKAGRTGGVDQPQLHFELRQGAKPVDPLPFMAQS